MQADERSLLTAKEAMELLEVRAQTLYAYVSRGLLRRLPGPDGRSRYPRADVLRLRTRKDARAGHGAVAGGALLWGEPVLPSSITEITAEGPRYRGVAAVDLARAGAPFEAVADRLWTGEGPRPREVRARWSAHRPSPRLRALRPLLPPLARPIDAVLLAAAALRGSALGALDSTEGLHDRARALITDLAAALALPSTASRLASALGPAPSIAARAAKALGARGPRCVALIDEALVLCADHELNTSAFTARVVASTGADLHAVVTAALAAVSGPAHGGATDRIEALLREVDEPGRAPRVLSERLARGDAIPGFGQPLYPDGDPRAQPLLVRACRLAPRRGRLTRALAVLDAMERLGAPPPAVDFALVAACEAMELPHGAALGLFALGRTAGLVAHALEQRETGLLLRPRARFVPSR